MICTIDYLFLFLVIDIKIQVPSEYLDQLHLEDASNFVAQSLLFELLVKLSQAGGNSKKMTEKKKQI